jgi:hypothetical protein
MTTSIGAAALRTAALPVSSILQARFICGAVRLRRHLTPRALAPTHVLPKCSNTVLARLLASSVHLGDREIQHFDKVARFPSSDQEHVVGLDVAVDDALAAPPAATGRPAPPGCAKRCTPRQLRWAAPRISSLASDFTRGGNRRRRTGSPLNLPKSIRRDGCWGDPGAPPPGLRAREALDPRRGRAGHVGLQDLDSPLQCDPP